MKERAVKVKEKGGKVKMVGYIKLKYNHEG